MARYEVGLGGTTKIDDADKQPRQYAIGLGGTGGITVPRTRSRSTKSTHHFVGDIVAIIVLIPIKLGFALASFWLNFYGSLLSPLKRALFALTSP